MKLIDRFLHKSKWKTKKRLNNIKNEENNKDNDTSENLP